LIEETILAESKALGGQFNVFFWKYRCQ
jgi:hypothetical protein